MFSVPKIYSFASLTLTLSTIFRSMNYLNNGMSRMPMRRESQCQWLHVIVIKHVSMPKLEHRRQKSAPHASFDLFSISIFCFAPSLLFLSGGVSLMLFLLFAHVLCFFGFLQFKTERIGIKRSKICVEFRVFEIWFSGVDQFNIFAIDIVWHPTRFVTAVHQSTVPFVGQRF